MSKTKQIPKLRIDKKAKTTILNYGIIKDNIKSLTMSLCSSMYLKCVFFKCFFDVFFDRFWEHFGVILSAKIGVEF